MKIDKVWGIAKNSLIIIGFVFILCSLFLFNVSVSALGGVSVNCADGGSVYCSGFRCDATEGQGCSCHSENGELESAQRCRTSGDMTIPETDTVD